MGRRGSGHPRRWEGPVSAAFVTKRGVAAGGTAADTFLSFRFADRLSMTNQIALYLLLCFTTVVTPGAGVFYTVSGALRYGVQYAWPCVAGNAFGVLVVSCLTVGGIGAVLAANPSVFLALQVAGALYLIYLGVKNWRAVPVDVLSLAQKKGEHEGAELVPQRVLFRDAVILQGSNPMLFLFLFALFPQFIVSGGSFVWQSSVLIAIFCLMVLAIHAAYAVIATFVRSMLSGKTVFLWINRAGGALFILLGLGVFAKLIAERL